MNLNAATALATALPDYPTLYALCRAGYRPTLTPARTDELPIRRAKALLAGALTASGCEVHLDRGGG